MKISTTDVLRITDAVVLGMTINITHPAGLTRKDLYTWFARGVIVPAEGGISSGKHARFTPLQVVAISYAAQWYRCGAGLDMVKKIVACVLSYSQKELEREFAKGNVFMFPIGDRCILGPIAKSIRKEACILCLNYIYKLVLREVEKLKRNHKVA